ncbi:FxSxx-COOH system tetratricopeptide repeat protein [Streptomyces sp. NPDC006465]|uniref:FxSxx-COOH system tetratricopeptide repeat protein n=1 Tax=Streptomyces sp. NPDC006465 TaxID=3157174 RepID=UPI0033B70E19
MSTLSAFALPWTVMTLAGAGPEASLALASTASAAVLSAGGWFAARDPSEARAEATPFSRLEGTLVVGPLPREPVAFQERTELVKAVDEAMKRNGVGVVCALTGGRGVGKTQLAGAYARSRIDAGWRVVAWIIAEEPGQIVAGLDNLAEAAGIKGGIQDAERAAMAVRQWLERLPEPALLVLDNVVDPDEVARWLPRAGQTRTLITSTVRSVTHLGSAVDIDVFTPAEAVGFLQERTGLVDDVTAGELVTDLGHLPLALAQAAWFIRTQGLTFAEYRERFRSVQAGQAMRRVPGETYPIGVAEALSLAVTQAVTGEHAQTVRRGIELVALMSPSGVHRQHLRAMLPERSNLEIDAAIGRMTEASVVTLSLDGGVVLMHRLVQRVVRDRLYRGRRLGARIEEAAAALRGMLPEPYGGLLSDGADRALPDHVLALWTAAEPLGDDALRGLLDLRRSAVFNLATLNELDRAQRLGQDVLADHERLMPHQDDATLAAVDALNHVYHEANQFHLSVALCRRSRDECQAAFGRDDPRTLSAVNRLGFALEGAGELDEALSLHSQNLADCLRVNGVYDQTALKAQINIASTLRSRGDNERALVVFEKNVTDNERVMGDDHPSTANSRGELARMYERVGRPAEALALYGRVLAALPGLYPPNHQTHLWWGRYHALALQSAGRNDESIANLSRLLRRSEQQLGVDHPESLCIRIFLARAYLAAHNYPEALTLFKTCVADRERVFGSDSGATLNARRNLGLAFLAAGQRSRGMACLRSVLFDYERVMGPQHPFTVGARLNLEQASATSRILLRRRSPSRT